jgi:carbonic anhydrase/acetyltransferase-like protein (isoleucine patch superfamily)
MTDRFEKAVKDRLQRSEAWVDWSEYWPRVKQAAQHPGETAIAIEHGIKAAVEKEIVSEATAIEDAAAGSARVGYELLKGAGTQVWNHPFETAVEIGAGVATTGLIDAAAVATGVAAGTIAVFAGTAIATALAAYGLYKGYRIASTEGIGAIPAHIKDTVASTASAIGTVYSGNEHGAALALAEAKVEALGKGTVPIAAGAFGAMDAELGRLSIRGAYNAYSAGKDLLLNIGRATLGNWPRLQPAYAPYPFLEAERQLASRVVPPLTDPRTGFGGLLGEQIALMASSVDATASVGPNTVIGRGASVGRNTEIVSGNLGENSSIGNKSKIGSDFSIGENGQLFGNNTIGNKVTIGRNSSLGKQVNIGDQSTIGDGAYIGKATPGDAERVTEVGAHVNIENGVAVYRGTRIGNGAEIGYGSTLHSNVTVDPFVNIGSNVIIEDGAHVTKTVLPNSVVRSDGTVVQRR